MTALVDLLDQYFFSDVPGLQARAETRARLPEPSFSAIQLGQGFGGSGRVWMVRPVQFLMDRQGAPE